MSTVVFESPWLVVSRIARPTGPRLAFASVGDGVLSFGELHELHVAIGDYLKREAYCHVKGCGEPAIEGRADPSIRLCALHGLTSPQEGGRS